MLADIRATIEGAKDGDIYVEFGAVASVLDTRGVFVDTGNREYVANYVNLRLEGRHEPSFPVSLLAWHPVGPPLEAPQQRMARSRLVVCGYRCRDDASLRVTHVLERTFGTLRVSYDRWGQVTMKLYRRKNG